MNTLPEILIKDFDYLLPPERIAAYPLPERDSSKLLTYKQGKIGSTLFKNLPDNLPDNSSLILNNTRVIEARIYFQKASGGVIEIFCLEPANNLIDTARALMEKNETQWRCLIGGASKWKHGEILQKEIVLEEEKLILSAKYINKDVDSFIINFSWPSSSYSFGEVLHAAGAIPLPPYIKRASVASDAERYQTIFAINKGSVAAPTAALHFTETVFNELAKKNITCNYLTLHVGAGTFKPVKSESVAEHKMHAEQFQVTFDTLLKLTQSNNIIAVGTTSLRTLESLYWMGVKIIKRFANAKNLSLEQWEAYDLKNENISYEESIYALINLLKTERSDTLFCKTSLIIVPGYKFHSAKALITNFHQPRSTLLLLIAAFIGEDWRKIYNHALENDFRFLSYGDSNLLWRKDD